MAVPYSGVFSKVQFPPHTHREYPKWVRTLDGKRVKVGSQQEEVALNLTHQSPRKNGEVDPGEAERNKLVQELAQARADLAAMQEQLAGMPDENEPKAQSEPKTEAKTEPPAPAKSGEASAKTQGLEALSTQSKTSEAKAK